MLEGVMEGQDAMIDLGLVAHIAVLLPYAHHDAQVPGAPNNG